MQIQAYRRTEATYVDLFDVRVDFIPNAAGHVVGDCTDERALERLLSISEAYRVYDPKQVPAAVVSAVTNDASLTAAVPPGGNDDDDNDEKGDPDAVLKGSDELPPEFTVGELTYTQAQIVDLAFARSGFTREEWNQNDEDDREALIEGEVTKLIVEHDQAEAKRIAEAEQPAPTETPTRPVETPTAVNPLLLTSGTETIDLGEMSESKLRAFAKENGVSLPGGKSTKVADLRLMVAKALTAPAA